MTQFETIHPRNDDGKFAVKPLASDSADLDLAPHVAPSNDSLIRSRDALNDYLAACDVQSWLAEQEPGEATLVIFDCEHETPYATFVDENGDHQKDIGSAHHLEGIDLYELPSEWFAEPPEDLEPMVGTTMNLDAVRAWDRASAAREVQESMLRAAIDGLGINDQLLFVTPAAVRDHFEDDNRRPVVDEMSDEQLAAAGRIVINSSKLYDAYTETLDAAIDYVRAGGGA